MCLWSNRNGSFALLMRLLWIILRASSLPSRVDLCDQTPGTKCVIYFFAGPWLRRQASTVSSLMSIRVCPESVPISKNHATLRVRFFYKICPMIGTNPITVLLLETPSQSAVALVSGFVQVSTGTHTLIAMLLCHEDCSRTFLPVNAISRRTADGVS